MAELPGVEETCQKLRDLAVGDRFDFVLAPGLAASPLHLAPTEDVLRAVAATAPRPIHVGLGWVAGDGRLVFAGRTLTYDVLVELAAWCAAQVATHPRLRVLHGCRFAVVRTDGSTRHVLRDPALWPSDQAPLAGSLAASDRELARLTVARDGLFWLTDHAEETGAPHLVVLPASADPTGARLAGIAAFLRGRAPVHGVVRWLESRVAVLIVDDEPERVRDGVRAVLAAHGDAHPGLRRLARARVVRLEEADAAGYASVDAPAASRVDLGSTARVLDALADGGSAYAWVTSAGPDGSPLLLLGDSRAAIEATVRDVRALGIPDGFQLQGRLTCDDGRVRLVLPQAYPGLVGDVAVFVARHQATWPSLSRLRGARASVGADGKAVEVADDDAWKHARAW